MSAPATTTVASDLAPVVDDMSIYLLAGRMKYLEGEGWVTPGGVVTEHLPAREEAAEAERLGFRRVFLSERHNVKSAGVIFGAAGAATSRIGLASGAMATSARTPIVNASLAATMNAVFGPRFVLGLGRGTRQLYAGHGFLDEGEVGYRHLVDHADIIRRLWQGETITYEGPAGRYEKLRMSDRPPIAPEIWFLSSGGPRASRIAANPVFDGHVLPDMLTPTATRKSVEWTRQECERTGRDPTTLRICQCVITAPDCDEQETRALVHARMALSLPYAGIGERLFDVNEWNPGVLAKLRSHMASLAGGDKDAVDAFHRANVLEAADLIPEAYIEDASAIGSAANCVRTLQRFRDAGADEIAVYGSTPAQNAGLIAAWATSRRS